MFESFRSGFVTNCGLYKIILSSQNVHISLVSVINYVAWRSHGLDSAQKKIVNAPTIQKKPSVGQWFKKIMAQVPVATSTTLHTNSTRLETRDGLNRDLNHKIPLWGLGSVVGLSFLTYYVFNHWVIVQQTSF